MAQINQVILALIILTLGIGGDETYLNSDRLCEDICKCSQNGDTFDLDCSNKQIEKTLANWPKDVGENVTEIRASFAGNDLKILKQFPGTKLKLKIVLKSSNIEEMTSGLFESSINVYYLDLSHNKINSETLSSKVFKGPYNETVYEPIALEYLNLGYNDIHSLNRNVFEHTPNLKYLNLEGNNFRVIDDQTALAFENIPKIRVLNLAFNRLTSVSNQVLRNFKDLTELDVSSNDIDAIPLSLGILKNLEILRLDNNPIRFLDEPSFLGMDNLLEIYAGNLRDLSIIKTDTFAPCKKLQKLDLSHNVNLGIIETEAFLNSEKLKELHLTDTKISTLLPDILNWKELNVLELSHNQLYCDCYLYNISMQLSDDIKRNKNGPYCRDIRSMKSLEVYSLSEEICTKKSY